MITEGFLHQVLDDILIHQKEFSDCIFIIPNRRPSLFIRKILSKKNFNGVLPQIFSLPDWIEEISGCRVEEDIPAIFRCYPLFRSIDENLSLEEFLKFFPTLRKDLSEIHAHSEEPSKVLDFLVSDERLKNWKVSVDEEVDTIYHKHLDFWKRVRLFWEKYISDCENRKTGDAGWVARKALEHLKSQTFVADKTYFFIGFNALTPIEEHLFDWFRKNSNAYFYWDADSFYLENTEHEVGKFLRNFQRFTSPDGSFKFIQNKLLFIRPDLIRCSNALEQIKIVGNELLKQNEDDFEDTAVVLADENLLLPLLQSLPERIQKFNVTMGFPLDQTEWAAFVSFTIKIQKKLSKGSKLEIKEGLAFKNFSIFSPTEKSYLERFFQQIQKKKTFYLSDKQLAENLDECLTLRWLLPFQNPLEWYDEMVKYVEEKTQLFEEGTINHSLVKSLSFVLNQLKPFVEEKETSWDMLLNWLRRLMSLEKLYFKGDPIQGIQIMGLLETRLLSFRQVFVLSCNEGILPQGYNNHSLIPQEIKKYLNLPDFSYSDAIFGYHFYRLLQWSRKSDLFFYENEQRLGKNERSRFLMQLEHEIGVQKVGVEKPKTQPVVNLEKTIEKTPAVLEKLHQWRQKGISASALNTYLRNPLDFYLKYVVGIMEEDETTAQLPKDIRGKIMHKVLEKCFKPFEGQSVGVKDVGKMLQSISNLLDEVLEEFNLPFDFSSGENYLEKKLMEKELIALLKFEMEQLEEENLKIIALEKRFEFSIKVDKIGTCCFKGIIDRIDELNGEVRILDYKTSKSQKLSVSNDLIFEKENQKHILQLGVYALYYAIFQPEQPLPKLGIWSFSSKDLILLNYTKGLMNDGILNKELIIETFSRAVEHLLLEIFNPSIPFVEREQRYYN